MLISFVCINFLTSTEQDKRESYTKTGSFSIDSFGDEEVLIMMKESQLLPGNVLKIYKIDGDNKNAETYEVKKVIFSKRSKVSIQLKSSTYLKGRLLNPGNTILSKGWEKTRTPVAFDTDDGTKTLNFKEIEFIRGNQKIVLDRPLGDLNPVNYLISIYQSKAAFINDLNRTEKSRWTNSASDENSSIYDLFTPPIIYLVNGELTTSLPEAPKEMEKEEDFGLSLMSFDKEEYRLKLASWIGNTPYFEDLQRKISESSPSNVKNRLELKVPYKENGAYRPGLPSFVKTTMDDEEKFLMVEYFTVQQIKDPKTGGVKSVGRALIKDFRNDGKTFEINSIMKKVYSGNFKILFKFDIEGIPTEDISIGEADIGKEFNLGDRNYKILSIDTENKSVQIEKKIPNKIESNIKNLSLEN